MPDSWRRSVQGGDQGHTEQLLPHTRLGSQEDESEQASEKQSPESRSKGVRAGARGLAIQLDAHGSWRAQQGSPWASVDLSPENLGAYSQVAILGGDAGSARELASGILRAAKRIAKPKPVLMRRLNVREESSDMEELRAAAGFVNGFMVPADGAQDPAVSFERTRRRVTKLKDNILESGWTHAPLIGIEAPNQEFVDRLARGLADFLVVRNPPRTGILPSEQVIVPVETGLRPWWLATPHYFYMPTSNELWWDDWMINPLTFTVVSE